MGKRTLSTVGYTVKADGSIEFHEGVSEEDKAEVLAQRAASLEYQARRRTLWGEIGPGSMTRLARMFPTLREADGVDPWSSTRFLAWLCGPAPGSGAYWAGLFILGVWNDLDWREEAGAALPKRRCGTCNGLGVCDRENGYTLRPGQRPREYVRTVYDDDGEPVGEEVVKTVGRCDGCDGEGDYQPRPGHPRFNLFAALKCWDGAHVAAFQTFVAYPFWP